jgi:hypothetical protein
MSTKNGAVEDVARQLQSSFLPNNLNWRNILPSWILDLSFKSQLVKFFTQLNLGSINSQVVNLAFRQQSQLHMR